MAACGIPASLKSSLGRELQVCKPQSELWKLVETVIKSSICGYVVPKEEAA